MFGRFIGLVAGFALLGEGYVLWRPEVISSLATPELGPFAPYQTLIAILAVVVGVAVLIASLLRAPGDGKRKSAPAAGPIEWGAPAPAASLEPAVSPLVSDSPIDVDPPELDPFPAAVEVASAPVIHLPSVDAASAVEVEHELVGEEHAAPAAHELAFVSAPAIALAAPEPSHSNVHDSFEAATAAGDRLRAQGRLGDAIDDYTEALALARARFAANPSDPAARRDLAHALTNVADVHDLEGRLDAAIDLHEESLALRRDLAAAAPDDISAQRDLSIGLERLADSREARGHRSRARDIYRVRLVLAEKLAAAAPENGELTRDLDLTRARLAELDEALAL